MPESIKCTNKGLIFMVNGKRTVIAPPIRVEASVQYVGSEDRFVRLHFRDDRQASVRTLVPMADLHTPRALKRVLLNRGYGAPSDDDVWLVIAAWLAASHPKKRLLVVDRVGWHGDAFVVPGREVQAGRQTLLYERESCAHVGDFSQKGSLLAWQTEVADLAKTSARAVFAICCALAGPLLHFTDVESGVFHFEGLSSKGKTTLLMVAMSIYGNPSRNSLITWDVTKAGLEELALGHNHCLLCLDEIARLDNNPAKAVRAAQQAAFLLAGGKGRVRSVVYGQQTGKPRNAEWRLLCLSNGETAISDMAASAKVDRLLGEQVRLIDIPAVGNPKLGIFDALAEGYDTPATMAEALERACLMHHGVVLPVWTGNLVLHMESIKERIDGYMNQFFELVGVPEGMGWERRFAKRFALAYAAGMLGVEFGVLLWEPTVVTMAVPACYRAARNRAPDAQASVRDGWKTFTSVVRGPRIIHLGKRRYSREELEDCYGFRREENGKEYYILKPAKFESWFSDKVQPHLVLQRLENRGLLIRPSTHHARTCQVRIDGLPEKHRYYKVRIPGTKGRKRPGEHT